jgi:two-component system NarL family response regulator
MEKIKILIVDDHPIVREGLKALLELEKDFLVVGETSSGSECFKKIEEKCPDVILLDIKMPGISGLEVTRIIKREKPSIKIILLTNYADEEYVLEAVDSGANGYVLKNIEKEDLGKIVHTVFKGGAFFDSTITEKVLQEIRRGKGKDTGKKDSYRSVLSQRELQILECLVEGKSNKEIAEIIHLSLDTVKTHLKNTYQKLGVHTRAQAIKVSVKKGLINLSR